MPLYDVSTILVDMSNKPLERNDAPITMRDVFVEILTLNDPNAVLSGQEKLKRFLLAKEIYSTEESIVLSIEDAAKIKELVGQYSSIIIVGQVFAFLEDRHGAVYNN